MNRHEELEQRLKKFAIESVKLINRLPKSESNKVYGKQLIRSSSSIGANYSEAMCAHTRLDFLHDINKSRKEAKESVYWLELLFETNTLFKNEITLLLQEARQLFKIFMSSVKTTKINMQNNKF